MDFRAIISKYKFDIEGYVYIRDEYVIKFEGYAYVLYKKIGIRTDSWSEMFEEPIAHFKDAKRLDLFLEILFDKLENK